MVTDGGSPEVVAYGLGQQELMQVATLVVELLGAGAQTLGCVEIANLNGSVVS